MAKAKTSSKLIKGNIFEYYVPKIHGAKPRPKQVSDKNDPTKKVYDKSKPASFLKNSFTKTVNVPFGKGSKKISQRVTPHYSCRKLYMLRLSVVTAVQECGPLIFF
ncbi:hypothetical protein P2W49_22010 [Yersinia intermedia]|nr:hypothetical protein P2W49_22010 [Yersinia intermedia]